MENIKRKNYILKLKVRGFTDKKIGILLGGLSHQRIHQIRMGYFSPVEELYYWNKRKLDYLGLKSNNDSI